MPAICLQRTQKIANLRKIRLLARDGNSFMCILCDEEIANKWQRNKEEKILVLSAALVIRAYIIFTVHVSKKRKSQDFHGPWNKLDANTNVQPI